MDQAQTPAKPGLNPEDDGAPSSTPNAPPASAAEPQPDPVQGTETETDKDAVSDEPGPSATSSASTTETASGNLKRPREVEEEVAAAAEISGDVPKAKRRVTATHDVVYRIVVPSRQIGKVIGRGGHRIQKIREDAKATIKIADAISRYEERVIIISSKDNDDAFSDAENALHQIVTLILQNDGGNLEAVNIGPGHATANTVRLLIAGSQAGGVIGVSGQNIENLRSTSGATISVLSPSQFPPCASAHESDRVVQISGEVPEVLKAVVEIGCQLRDNPPKQVISINPINNSAVHRQTQQYVDPTSVDYATMDLLVPENLVGGLIGRFGANISRIRNESGANIKVYGSRGEQTQRQIHLVGSAQQVALAKQRVDEYVYAELMRQAGGQLQQTASSQLQQFATHQTTPDMSSTLYHGYSHVPGLYAASGHETAMIAALPEMYASTAVNPLSTIYASSAVSQDPSYYAHQPYPAPEL